MSFEDLDKQVSESAPLLVRLDDCMDRIGKMCKEGRPPKMTIPCQWNDDDIFIVATIKEAVEQLRALDLPSGSRCTCGSKDGYHTVKCFFHTSASQ